MRTARVCSIDLHEDRKGSLLMANVRSYNVQSFGVPCYGPFNHTLPIHTYCTPPSTPLAVKIYEALLAG